MAEISDSLRLLFETEIETDGDRYVVSLPKSLVEDGSLSLDETYRVALLAAADGERGATETSTSETEPAETGGPARSRPAAGSRGGQTQEPPVSEGDIRTVTIDTLGDQGDGIAKVERGFIVIVPGTEPGDQLNVEITDVKETVAFAEPVESDA
ncbi:predicted RNA-binding protein, contains TRAM domain [Halarchaeum acidiphilum MH1-52-1]|uniref:Predicted RNA-binding protein, contains TRAM domain n=1 Tax=Halarchaeum acidiphilum MH1-52-1 TaxID=1261545 RepID=U2YVF0_9EURY|nr:TRAM domain-containing protein [Halarchaeum acidiphilum]GAD53000.1 predicted RNA-binding protein, contains TRAM domain [Halarchaeum acidiphilum MH1-52-1]